MISEFTKARTNGFLYLQCRNIFNFHGFNKSIEYMEDMAFIFVSLRPIVSSFFLMFLIITLSVRVRVSVPEIRWCPEPLSPCSMPHAFLILQSDAYYLLFLSRFFWSQKSLVRIPDNQSFFYIHKRHRGYVSAVYLPRAAPAVIHLQLLRNIEN